MTHVFVAPHPDDVALSCGGLIASLRELGQNVAIVTVFSGNTESDDLTTYQREALGFGGKTLWPATEAFNRSSILADYPTAAAAQPWAASDPALDATQTDADAAAKRFWQRSSWYRRASIRNVSLAGQPVIDDLSTQGAVLTEEVVDAFEVPLSFLMTPDNHRTGSRVFKGTPRYFYEMPFKERYIWGITAGIIRGLYQRVYG